MGELVSRVTVISAKRLDSATLDGIISRIRKKAGEDVEINIEIDPDLIGGIIIRHDDIVYDGSVRYQLERIKRQLKR